MAWVFAIFATIAGMLGWLMPHIVHRIGFRMALAYLSFGIIAAFIGLLKRSR